MRKYDPSKIEKKWSEEWKKTKLYQTADFLKGKENEYILVEFVYPSGNLHAGHWYAFSVTDIYARYRRMLGKNVMFPMGFDAFGLPAENAAIKNKVNPKDWTEKNIDYMRKQLRSMGAMFDWSREVVTADPSYYKWTQWLFIKLFEAGLAYQAEIPVNWCPSCKTVLANEQVIKGKCERCESVVEQRSMKQWLLRITNYADRLIEDLEHLNWPEPIKLAQKNWIGRSEGAEIEFKLKVSSPRLPTSIKVFTTRADTIFGATYLVLSPEHEVINLLRSEIKNGNELVRYIEQTKKKTELERLAEGKDKTGVELKGIKAINPANKEEIPIWVADYVLSNVGTGAIMAVPAHDKRDFEFARKYDLPLKRVVEPCFITTAGNDAYREKERYFERDAILAIVKHWSEDKYLGLRWKKVDWQTLITGGPEGNQTLAEGAKQEILVETGYKNPQLIRQLLTVHSKFFHIPKNINRFAHLHVFYFELQNGEREEISDTEKSNHDVLWLPPGEMSQFLTPKAQLFAWNEYQQGFQIYEGEGVLVNSDQFSGGDSIEAREKITEYVGGGGKTTFKMRDWVVSRQRYWGCPIPVIHCEKCGAVPVNEEDLPIVLPEVKDYLPSDNGRSPLSKVDDFVKTKCPKCGGGAGRETDTLDTFVDSSWYFLRYTDSKNNEEFVSKKKQSVWMPVNFYSGGAEHTTMHLLYSRFFHKALYDLGLVNESEPYERRMNRGLILGPDGQKMSKSRGNVVDPDDYVKKLGTDTVRTYLAFIGPYNEGGSYPWSPDSIVGVRRFLERVWKLAQDKVDTGTAEENLVQKTIRDVTESLDRLKINTAVASLMTFINNVEKTGISKKQLEVFLKLLAPFAPHLTEEIWEQLGGESSVHTESWPMYDQGLIRTNSVKMVVQVNGKVVSVIDISPGLSQSGVEKLAMDEDRVRRRMADRKPKKIIFIKDKIINFVL